jgi:hypothetical protein
MKRLQQEPTPTQRSEPPSRQPRRTRNPNQNPTTQASSKGNGSPRPRTQTAKTTTGHARGNQPRRTRPTGEGNKHTPARAQRPNQAHRPSRKRRPRPPRHRKHHRSQERPTHRSINAPRTADQHRSRHQSRNRAKRSLTPRGNKPTPRATEAHRRRGTQHRSNRTQRSRTRKTRAKHGKTSQQNNKNKKEKNNHEGLPLGAHGVRLRRNGLCGYGVRGVPAKNAKRRYRIPAQSLAGSGWSGAEYGEWTRTGCTVERSMGALPLTDRLHTERNGRRSGTEDGQTPYPGNCLWVGGSRGEGHEHPAPPTAGASPPRGLNREGGMCPWGPRGKRKMRSDNIFLGCPPVPVAIWTEAIAPKTINPNLNESDRGRTLQTRRL